MGEQGRLELSSPPVPLQHGAGKEGGRDVKFEELRTGEELGQLWMEEAQLYRGSLEELLSTDRDRSHSVHSYCKLKTVFITAS